MEEKTANQITERERKKEIKRLTWQLIVMTLELFCGVALMVSSVVGLADGSLGYREFMVMMAIAVLLMDNRRGRS